MRSKLTLALIREEQSDLMDNTLYLPQARGGKMVPVTVGKVPDKPRLDPMTLKEAQVMSSKAHLTGEQQKSILADLRCKFGQKIVKPGLKLALPVHNKKFAGYFTVGKMPFLNSDGELEEKHLFYCHSPVEFLEEVDRQRGRQGLSQATIIQGDSGQGYTKIAVSRIDMKELEEDCCTRIPGAGVDYLEDELEGTSRKRRRSREDGIEDGEQFQDWGARKLFILAVVYKVQENAYNLETIFKAIKLEQLNFRFTGDFAFFMPSLGLLKGCSSCNPCPLCDQERTKEGGVAKWVEGDTNLRSFGSLLSNYASWGMEGERTEAVHTKKWKSVTGPVLVMGEGDTFDTLMLDKIIPGPLHLYLSVNEVLNHCEKNWPELKSVLKVHVYQGKVGNYEGPSIRKIFKKLESIKPHMEEGDKRLYYETLLAFKQVSQSVFGKKLHPSWREHIHTLRYCMDRLNRSQGMPITPKFHVLTVHIEQWIDRHGRAMGKESESSGEALHHLWKRMLDGKGEVKIKESEAYVVSTLQSLLKFNADNV